MLSKLTADGAGTHQYISKIQLAKLHSKHITTFKSQKFKKYGKINLLKPILCNESSYFYARIKATSCSKIKQTVDSDPPTEKMNVDVLSERDDGMFFVVVFSATQNSKYKT